MLFGFGRLTLLRCRLLWLFGCIFLLSLRGAPKFQFDQVLSNCNGIFFLCKQFAHSARFGGIDGHIDLAPVSNRAYFSANKRESYKV